MTLPSIAYALFLLSVVGMYWTLGNLQARLWLLIVASLIFYGSLQVQYLLLIGGPDAGDLFHRQPPLWLPSTGEFLTNAGSWLRKDGTAVEPDCWHWVSLSMCCCCWALNIWTGVFRLMGLGGDGTGIAVGPNDTLVRIIMPLGISFFCVRMHCLPGGCVSRVTSGSQLCRFCCL